MTDAICSVEGCEKRPHGRGWCEVHYRRWYEHGTTADPEWAWVLKDDPAGCWLWTGATTGNGYGRLRRGNRFVMAHRHFYVLLGGEISEGLELDHLCRVRNCVNPEHLEPVTHLENMRRRFAAETPRETCAEGHPLTDNNVYRTKGTSHLRCRTCNNEWQRARRKRLRQRTADGA